MTGEQLLLWRHARRLSKAALGRLLRVGPKSIMNWERGLYRLPDDLPARLQALDDAAVKYALWTPEGGQHAKG